MTEEAVGHPSRRQGEDVGARRIEPVERARDRDVHPHAMLVHRRDHEQNQQRADAVIAEALPHLSEEERGKAARMAEEGMIVGGRQRVGGHSPDYRRLLQLWVMSVVYER